MMNEPDFIALLQTAADLDDLRLDNYFGLDGDADTKRFRRLVRSKTTNASEVVAALATQSLNGGLKLNESGKIPAWARNLQRALAFCDGYRDEARGSLESQLVAPILAYACAELERRLKRHKFHPCVHRRFEAQLENNLLQTIKSCLELNLGTFEAAFRCVNPASGPLSAEEVEERFIGNNVALRLNSLLQTYPALGKLWSQLIVHWIDKIAELKERLDTDRKAIRRTFFAGRSPGELIDVTLNVSDPHHCARETIVLYFKGGGSVVYKPRTGRSEADWLSFVRWINRKGFAPRLSIFRLLRRSSFCWMEYVPHQPCRTRSAAERYYRRAGGLICSAYLFGAADLHRHNLIAAGEYPTFIDLETLIHRAVPATRRDAKRSLAATSLLPFRASFDEAVAEVAAFGGTSGRHTPTLHGIPLVPSEYLPEIESGCRAMWNLIGEVGTEGRAQFQRRLRALRKKKWRQIYRATRTYYQLREKSVVADALESGLKRSQTLLLNLLELGGRWAVVREEVSAIARFDIPCLFEAAGAPSDTATPEVALSTLLSLIRFSLVLGTRRRGFRRYVIDVRAEPIVLDRRRLADVAVLFRKLKNDLILDGFSTREAL